jgi:predicted metal-binding membrane protein
MLNSLKHRTLGTYLLLLLSAAAWIALWLWGASPYARYLSHHALVEVRGSGLLMGVYTLSWLFMIVAMMLPTTLPLVNLFARLIRQHKARNQLLALLLLGYLSIWTLFGFAAYVGDLVLHEMTHRVAWLETNIWLLGALTYVLAGVYQFTPLKYYCLDQCRSPMSFVTTNWRGRRERVESFLLGAHHGLFCLGCCWTLMLVMFAVGSASLGWMLILGLFMAAEKNAPWGKRVSAPLGAALIIWGYGLVVAAGPIW